MAVQATRGIEPGIVAEHALSVSVDPIGPKWCATILGYTENARAKTFIEEVAVGVDGDTVRYV